MRWLYELADNKDFVGLFESLEHAKEAAEALSGERFVWHEDADDPGAGWFAVTVEDLSVETFKSRWEIMRMPLYETVAESLVEIEEKDGT